MRPPETAIYKIVTTAEWDSACAVGRFIGSAVDQADGFIHFSARDQVAATAAKHFANQDGLVLVGFDTADFDDLVWEESRGGQLFPHLYRPLPTGLARNRWPLPLTNAGHLFPWSAEEQA